MPPHLSAVVVARGDRTALEACLVHLRRGAPADLDIVVVGPPSPWLAGQTGLRTIRGDLRDGLLAATGEQVLVLDEGVLLPRHWSQGLVLTEGVEAIGPVAHGLCGDQHDGSAVYRDLDDLRALASERRRRHGTATVVVPWLAPQPLLVRREALLAVTDLDDPSPELGALRAAPGVLVHVEPRPGAGSWPRPHPAPLLSAALIVRDEQGALPACLASLVGIVDEVVVVDTGSVDDTRRVVTDSGATLLHHPWDDDFAAARNAALAACRGVWVLSIDADEQLCVEDALALRAALARSSDQALRLPIRSRAHRDDPLGYEHHAPRLLRRGAVVWVGAIHEVPVSADTHGWIDTPPLPGVRLDHDGYLEEVLLARGKAERNLRLAEKDLARTPVGDARRWKATYELARTLGIQEAARVEQLTSECLALDPPAHFRGNALVLRSGALLNLGRLEDAEEAARKALVVSPELVTPTLALAAVLEARGRAEDALAVLNAWVPNTTDPTKEQLLRDTADRLRAAVAPYVLEATDPLAALEKWGTLPVTTTTLVGRSRCLLALGRIAEAADALEGIDVDALDLDELFVVVTVAATAGDRQTAQWLLSRAGPLPPAMAAEAAALSRALAIPVRVEERATSP